jgi:hypothetical protein
MRQLYTSDHGSLALVASCCLLPSIRNTILSVATDRSYNIKHQLGSGVKMGSSMLSLWK